MVVDLSNTVFLQGNDIYNAGFTLMRDVWHQHNYRPTMIVGALGKGPIGPLCAHELSLFYNGSDEDSVRHGVVDPRDLEHSLENLELESDDRVLVVGDVARHGSELKSIKDAIAETGTTVKSAVVYARITDADVDFYGFHEPREIVLPYQLHIGRGEEERPLTMDEVMKHKPWVFKKFGEIAKERLERQVTLPDGKGGYNRFDFRTGNANYEMMFCLARRIFGVPGQRFNGDRYKPDHIIGFWRGGGPLEEVTEEYSRWRGIHTSTGHLVKFYSYKETGSGKLVISGLDEVLAQIREGQDGLLVDELAHTGQTLAVALKVASERVGEHGSIELAVMDWKPGENETIRDEPLVVEPWGALPEVIPRFSLFDSDGIWIVYPQELTGPDREIVIAHKTGRVTEYLQ